MIPARDEAPRIAEVLRRVAAALPHADRVVVDGGSRDNTADVARREGATVVSQDGHGYAGALMAGYRYCRTQGYSQIVQLDADGQHPPEAALELLRRLDQANWVVGSRAGTKSPGTLPRRLGNGLLALAVSGLSGVSVKDATSGFWAMDREALAIFTEHLPTDVADANVRVIASRHGIRMRECQVRMPARAGGTSMHQGSRAVFHLLSSFRAVYREVRRPTS